MNAKAREKSIWEESVDAVNKEMGDPEPAKARPAKKAKTKPVNRFIPAKKKKVGRPASEDPITRATFTIPQGLLARAVKKAKEDGRPMSNVVARLLAAWVEGR
jgi:hypothetical protein